MAMGCAEVQPNEREDTAVTDQALASAMGNTSSGGDADGRFTNPWASPGVVNLCFVGPNGAPNATLISEVLAALADSWGSSTGLNFVNNGQCPSPAPTAWISVFLQEVNDNGISYGGIGARLPPSADINNRTDIQTRLGLRPGEYRRQVVHEFGHALGFYHELERSEQKGDCTGAATGSNVLGHLTPYDQNSIMSWTYCTNTLTETELLTPMDRLGAEMMYPKASSGYKLACGGACVETATGAVVRANGSVTIDWVKRGADVDPVWTVGTSQYTPSNGMLAASYLTATTTNITMIFPDAYSNSNFGMYIPQSQRHTMLRGGGTVVKSDSIHTAIVATATSYL
jgi:hypothetical protein